MKINCLSCGFKVDLADSYDNYEGHVKCYACGATLNIRAEEGEVFGVQLVGPTIEIDILETVVQEARTLSPTHRDNFVPKARVGGAPHRDGVVHQAKPGGSTTQL